MSDTDASTPVAEAPVREVMNTDEAAEYLRLGHQQLALWRHLKRGPAYVKLSRRVRYRKADLDAWMAANVITPDDAK